MCRPANYYLQDLIALANRLEARELLACGPGKAKRIMNKASFAKMSDPRQSHYRYRCELAQGETYQDIAEQREKLMEVRRQLNQDIEEEKVKERLPPLKIICARFTSSQEAWISERWSSPCYSERNVNDMVRRMLESPAPRSEDPGNEPNDVGLAKPLWFKQVCDRRREFADVDFMLHEGGDIVCIL